MPTEQQGFSSAISDINPGELKTTQSPALSFGEKLVGITFNPSNDGDVNEIKTKMAELANMIHDKHSNNETSQLSVIVYHSAIQHLLDAQMAMVKYVTLKY